MLGFLLARAGVTVRVLEKHRDFFRDFRGDTLHPSTLQVMDELGLLEDLLRQPHEEMREVTGHFGDKAGCISGTSQTIPGKCKFIAFMPQWDFLNFVSRHAKKHPEFQLQMETEVTDLIVEAGRVVGVKASGPDGRCLRCAAGLWWSGRTGEVRRSFAQRAGT